MGKDEVIAKLRQYKKLLSEHLDIKEVILYGSYATGTPREDSDIDVAIVVNQIKGDYFSTTPLAVLPGCIRSSLKCAFITVATISLKKQF